MHQLASILPTAPQFLSLALLLGATLLPPLAQAEETSKDNSSSTSPPSAGVIVGIVILLIVLSLFVATGILYWRRRTASRRRINDISQPTTTFHRNGPLEDGVRGSGSANSSAIMDVTGFPRQTVEKSAQILVPINTDRRSSTLSKAFTWSLASPKEKRGSGFSSMRDPRASAHSVAAAPYLRGGTGMDTFLMASESQMETGSDHLTSSNTNINFLDNSSQYSLDKIKVPSPIVLPDDVGTSIYSQPSPLPLLPSQPSTPVTPTTPNTTPATSTSNPSANVPTTVPSAIAVPAPVVKAKVASSSINPMAAPKRPDSWLNELSFGSFRPQTFVIDQPDPLANRRQYLR
ncbi:hypothetical protein H4R33_002254 [Dimargaris cristalligena]|uniref:Uncharacterized protein n=1 Tax=Dimargaris cristalligena TaxID=215637 RepID=A0A4Q0A425_9FUNG|nr:hypothetical protein H4R33_002254 [Dimargaris cristalligena]RKP40331.1 hypothetical protein BJ085DRAFT_29982 [Dimargaris cristalligena]|eukprot:RKP40331.1 hypothetical protein BJ085DRAFT_29982 [Dimargaris cristalligena]